MGFWPDPWDELSYFEEELLYYMNLQLGRIEQELHFIYHGLAEWIGDGLGDIGEGEGGILQAVVDAIAPYLQSIGDSIAAIASDVVAPIIAVFSDIGDGLADIWEWIKGGFSAGFDYIGDALKELGGDIIDSALSAAGSVTDYVSIMWDDIKGFMGDQYDTIIRFWGDLAGDVYNWISDGLEALWNYFIEVVIPVFMDALGWVFDSPPVKWLVGLFEEHILSVFRRLADIDSDDLVKWIRESFGLMQSLAKDAMI